MNALVLLMGANGLLSLVALVAGIFSLIFDEPPTQEELERASMRSMSWPTTREAHHVS
jgi:hypothetical protein